MNERFSVLSIGSDQNLFKEGSAVRARAAEYGKLFRELHIVCFTRKSSSLSVSQIAPNVWAYPTNSLHKIFYVNDGIDLAKKTYREKLAGNRTVITVQDPFESGIVGAFLKRILKLPLHVQLHTDFFHHEFTAGSVLNKIRVWIAPFVMRRANSVRVVSEHLRLLVCNAYDLDPTRVAVLPIFVDVEKLAAAAPEFSLHDQHPGFSTFVLMVSRLTAEKNISLGLRVFAKAAHEMTHAALSIVGSGPLEWRLKREAQALGIADRVFFEGWQNNTLPYYKSADVFMLASSFEGYGMTVIEAAACKTPIVATHVGIVREIIPQKFERFISEIGDEKNLTSSLAELLEGREIRQEYGKMLCESVKRYARTKEEYLEKYKASLEIALLEYVSAAGERQ
jgi:glycosyltransferase involved in cell wall biosynthesis